MGDDAINTLAELRDELDVALQRVSAIPRPAAAKGHDPSGAMTVTVDVAGRVTEVAVAQRWRALLGAEAVAAAVREAATAASQAQMSAWTETAGGNASTEPRPRPLPLPHESLGARLADLTARDSSGERRRVALEELLTVLDAAERSLGEAVRRMETRAMSCYTGFNKTRQVMVSIDGGGMVVDVRCDLRWLNATHDGAIGREITAAFRAAYQDFDAAGDSSARRTLDEFRELATDPRALARRLYLCDE